LKERIKSIIIKVCRKLIRSIEYEQELDTLFFFLNSFFDIRDVQKAAGPLRELQECDVMLLKAFHEICKQLNLEYWIDSGTLLGMYRHQGFIPWDDDMDVCMSRDDYERALELLPDVCARYGIDVSEFPDYPMACFGIGYKHQETGIWLDVFPVDMIEGIDISSSERAILQNLTDYKKYYLKRRKRKTVESIKTVKNKYMHRNLVSGNDTLFYLGVEYDYYKYILNRKENIYPLKTASFEGTDVTVPNNTEAYLNSIYGDSYMQFPRNGVVHHGGEQGKLYEWAKVNNTDMAKVKKELEDIYNTIIQNNWTV